MCERGKKQAKGEETKCLWLLNIKSYFNHFFLLTSWKTSWVWAVQKTSHNCGLLLRRNRNNNYIRTLNKPINSHTRLRLLLLLISFCLQLSQNTTLFSWSQSWSQSFFTYFAFKFILNISNHLMDVRKELKVLLDAARNFSSKPK